jgi:hypothetical protein
MPQSLSGIEIKAIFKLIRSPRDFGQFAYPGLKQAAIAGVPGKLFSPRK